MENDSFIIKVNDLLTRDKISKKQHKTSTILWDDIKSIDLDIKKPIVCRTIQKPQDCILSILFASPKKILKFAINMNGEMSWIFIDENSNIEEFEQIYSNINSVKKYIGFFEKC